MLADASVTRFGRFTLDEQHRMLLSDGKPVALHAKTFDLLVFFVAHAGEVVSRDEILAAVWQGQIVSDSALAFQLSALRKVLEQAGGGVSILTLPKQRYRFVAEAAQAVVAPVTEPPPAIAAATVLPTRAGLRWRYGVLAGVSVLLAASLCGFFLWRPTPAAPRLSMVVLPFRSLSADHAQDYLADAITDDLISDLAHVPQSTVIARESSAAVKDQAPEEIGRALHVRYIIRGTLLREETRFHVTAYLIDAAGGAVLWTRQFETNAGAISDVRETIARAVASHLHFELDQQEAARSRRDRGDNPDALDLFFQARALLDNDRSLTGLTEAQRLLSVAIAKQPDFIDGEAALSWLLLRKVSQLDDPDDSHDYALAKSMVSRIMAVSPHHDVGLAARARLSLIDGNCNEAESYAQNLLSDNPSSVLALYPLAQCAYINNRFEDAIRQYKHILQINPYGSSTLSVYTTLGFLNIAAGRPGEATDWLTRSIAGQPGLPDPSDTLSATEEAQFMLIAAHWLRGERDSAKQAYDIYNGLWKHRTVWRLSELLPKKWRLVQNMQGALDALQQAGMPRYEPEPAPGLPAASTCAPGIFAPTPASVVGARTVQTSELAGLLKSDKDMLVIDVGRGMAVIPGAVWFDLGQTTLSAQDFTLQQVRKRLGTDTAKPIAVVGDGAFGCEAYWSVQQLVAHGYSAIYWYRGGEEAWDQAHQASEDRRLQ